MQCGACTFRHIFVAALVSAALLHVVVGQECSSTCSNEFVNCVSFKSNTIAAQAAYIECRDELCQSIGPLGSACPDCTCTDTSDMAALDPSGNYTCSSTNCGGGGGGGGGNMCSSPVSGTPSFPTLCTPESDAVLVYTFYPHSGDLAGAQRYFSITNYPDADPTTPIPVLINVNGYGTDSKVPQAPEAEYYNFAYMQISSSIPDGGAGGFNLQFGADGVANDENPTPCSESDSRDIVYMQAIFDWIASQDAKLDAGRVFLRGFSQNSMFAAYVAVCFSDNVAGLWQGGSGLALTGHVPVTPGAQGQCRLSDFLADGTIEDCCSDSFCEECKYWPLYPKTCANEYPERKLIDCIAAYTDDGIACGGDKYMFDAMVREGNDARLLSFSPGPGIDGGHRNPMNSWAWIAGCLGLSEPCSSACENAFVTCVNGLGGGPDPSRFETCESSLQGGSLDASCAEGCSPTLAMLELSETPVMTLSEGRFGQTEGLQASTTAPDPTCQTPFGSFETTAHPTCNPPGDTVYPNFDEYPSDSVCERDDDDGSTDAAHALCPSYTSLEIL